MPVSERVIVELEARLGRYEANIAAAERKFSGAMSSIQGSANRTEGLVARAMGGISGAVAGVSALALARTFLDIADTAKNLEAQLRLATRESGSFAKAQSDVRRIAADTRTELEATAALYGNFARSSRELGITQDQAARATETVAKTFKISGAGAVEASQGTRQLVQALQSGVLRGDEFNTIMEAAPRLARLLADSLGVPIGQLRAMAEAGQLTSDKLVRALTDKRFTAGLDAEFRELPVTFDEAMTQIENAAIITFGAFDRGGQFSSALANFITQGTDGFKDLEQSALEFGIAARSNIEGLASAFAPVFAEGQRLFNFLSGGFQGVDIGRDIQKSLDQIDMGTKWLSGRSLPGALLTGNSASDYFNGRNTGTNFGGRYRQGQQQAEARLRNQMAERATADRLGQYFDRFGNPKSTSTPARAAPGSAASTKKTGGGSAEAAARRAENERLRAIREEASQQRDAARLDDEILAAKAALATAANDVLKYQLDAIESERAQQVADIETRVKLGDLAREEADRRILVNSELASLRGDLVKRRAAEAVSAQEAARYRDEAATLEAEAQLIDARKERRDVELRILDLAYKEEESAIRRAAANGDIADLDEALANLRRRQAADVEGVNRQAEGPLARYRRDLDNPDRRNDEVEAAVVGELEDVRDSISSAVQKTLGVKNPILAALINSFIEQQLIRPILDGLGGASGGGGGFFGSVLGGIGSLFGGRRAIGGPVQAGKAYRVGEAGEEMFVPQQNGVVVPNHRLRGGGGPTIITQSFTLDARGGVTTPELLQYVNTKASQAAAQMGGVVSKGLLKAMPGRLAGFNRDGT